MHDPSGNGSRTSERGAHERLLRLAGMYRGLSRRDLAQALGRDPSNVFPPNGNPKLDYLDRLAHVLDWPLGIVAETILHAPDADAERAAEPGAFETLDREAKAAHVAGDYPRMRALAEQMRRAATTPDERALSALREAGAWDGTGRYTAQLDAIRRGLAEAVTRPDLRLLLRANLANAHYTLWYLFEARSMARELIDGLEARRPTSRAGRAARAFGYYVLGNTDRRLFGQQSESPSEDAKSAKAALGEALRQYTGLAAEFDNDAWRGIANTCRGAILETEVALDARSPREAVDEIERGIATVRRRDGAARGDLLESYGWWCIFGCNIALRHLVGRELQQRMAGLTSTGREIARRLGNWAMHERLFTLERMRRVRLNDLAGCSVEWPMEREEVGVLVGTMGRFPTFRETGWRILDETTVVESNLVGRNDARQ